MTLTPKQEQRLSTVANCITLACFNPLNNCKVYNEYNLIVFSVEAFWAYGGAGRCKLSISSSMTVRRSLNASTFLEIFFANVRRVNTVMEERYGVENPGNSPRTRALVGTIA